MGGIFGKSKQSRVTQQDKAILQLKQQRDKLKQYQKKIEVQLLKDKDTARTLLKDGKKEKAKVLLRKKKFQESLLEKTDKQLDNIDTMVHDIEFAQVEQQVILGLKQGNEALNKMHQLLSLENVEKILDETRDAVEYQKEIDELLAGGLTDQDEADVLSELNEIVKESLPSVPSESLGDGDVELPDVPSTNPAATSEQRRVKAKVASES